tara:strand:+ start:155 stop:601 length:447 start_codon:yes stop_codon:yes gene_type:complete
MKLKYILLPILSLLLLGTLYAQNSSETFNEKLLIGNWEYEKLIDENNVEVTTIPRMGTFGWESAVVTGPDLRFSENNSCLKFTPNIGDLHCSWNLKTPNIIYYSELRNEKDEVVRDPISQKIKLLTEKNLILEYENGMYFVYKKLKKS